MIIDTFVEQSFLLALNSSYEKVTRKLNAELKEYGCNFLQSMILISVLLEQKKVTPSKLALSLKTSKSNISHAISSLEKGGLVVRETCKSDSRKWEISLTTKGKTVVNKQIKIIEHYEDTFEDEIGKPQITKVIQNLNSVYSLAEEMA